MVRSAFSRGRSSAFALLQCARVPAERLGVHLACLEGPQECAPLNRQLGALRGRMDPGSAPGETRRDIDFEASLTKHNPEELTSF